MHEVGTEYSNVLLEPRQHRLADTERLKGFFVGTGEKVFVMRRGQAEDVAEDMRNGKRHGCDPFHGTLGSRQM